MAKTGTVAGDKNFLFRPIQSTKHGEALRSADKISYSHPLELFKKKLKSLGFKSTMIALHSLRAGGATAAAGAGVPDRLFKSHGRWCSENAKDGYVKDKLEARLKLSKNLGLYPDFSFFVTLQLSLKVANPQWWQNQK